LGQDQSPGLRSEAKGLEAIQEMQKRRWEFRDFQIIKAVRTCWHPNKRIKKLESKKIDLIVVFDRKSQPLPKGPMIFVLQVKSTHKSYRRFCNSPNRRRNIKCILIFEHEPIDKVIEKLDAIFKEILNIPSRRNPFLRPRIPLNLL
jgi:hypothetical protein